MGIWVFFEIDATIGNIYSTSLIVMRYLLNLTGLLRIKIILFKVIKESFDLGFEYLE